MAARHAADRARTEPRSRHDQSRAGAFRAQRADRIPADIPACQRGSGRQSGARRNRDAAAAGRTLLAARTARCACWCWAAARARARSTARCRRRWRDCGGTRRGAPSVRRAACARKRARAYADAGIVASVEPFIADMADAYAWADLVVCRAGALTLAELCAAGVGSVLVPFPQAVDDHQTRNARVPGRARRRACCCRRATRSRDELRVALATLASDPARRAGDGAGRARARQTRCRRTRGRHRLRVSAHRSQRAAGGAP